jgi:para-nitrobenzyl esterase
MQDSSAAHAGTALSSDGAAPAPRACPVAPSTDPLVVATDKGLVKGTHAGSGLAFLGIPFAKPPVGALRFMPPEPTACWSDVRDATQFGNICAQFNVNTQTVAGQEDCLFVNVWTPALPSPSSKPLPVLFWLYGGDDMFGGSSDPELNGQTLANAQNAVVVSFNYRVGALGFLAHPALAAANPQHTTGNYGLLDAILALQWVQDNIASFGGDKSRVLLFGQSAGAINTCALFASPLTHGLFSSVLMESGNCAAEGLPYRYPRGAAVATTVNCELARDVAACLQSAPVSAILPIGAVTFVGSFLTQVVSASFDPAHLQDLPFAPTVDGYVLEATPAATIQAGKHNHVPLAIGTNAREAGFLPSGVAAQIPVASCAAYAALFTALLPGIALPLLKAYPCDLLDPLAGYKQASAVLADAFVTCPSRRALRAAAATQTEPVYRYQFTHGFAQHGAELPYVWGTFATAPTPAESLLSHEIQAYWTNLAASGNPNGAGLPIWKAYVPSLDNALQLETPIGEMSAIETAGCDFFDSVE